MNNTNENTAPDSVPSSESGTAQQNQVNPPVGQPSVPASAVPGQTPSPTQAPQSTPYTPPSTQQAPPAPVGYSHGADQVPSPAHVQSTHQNQAGSPAQPAQRYQQPYQAHQPHHAQSVQQHKPVYQAPAENGDKKSGGGAKNFLVSFLGAALAVVIGLSAFGLYNSFVGNENTSGGSTVLGSSSSNISATDPDATLAEAVAEKALPSVAYIAVYTEYSSGGMFGFGGSGDSETQLIESSLGSGVVLTEDGYIITNYHVIANSDALEVTVGGETYTATIVGSDPSSDIAVIKAEGASGLLPIEIGSSEDLVIGEWVMTIGSPFGLEQSVATGIISATSRSQIIDSTDGTTTIYSDLIQTDAAINPGNSGGALVDADGKLIGINTLITSSSGSFAGVGFAIPVDYAIRIAQQIIDGETPSHAQLGVSLSTITPAIAERYGFSVESGAYITQIYSDSGAAAAGLQEGDIITKINDTAITGASDLMIEIRAHNPGDVVTIEFSRNGETLTAEVTLGSDATTSQSSYSSSLDNDAVANAA